MSESLIVIGKGSAVFFRFAQDDDFIDRLNRAYTISILILFSIFLNIYHLTKWPVDCYLPGSIGKEHKTYVNQYCYISNTYFLPLSDPIPLNINQREDRELNYYQWASLSLLAMAFFFYVPSAIWRGITSNFGYDVKAILETANSVRPANAQVKPAIRKDKSKTVANHLDYLLQFKQDLLKALDLSHFLKGVDKILRRSFKFTEGKSVFIMYLVVKLIYITNSISQILFLQWFIGAPYVIFGAGLLSDVLKYKPWRRSGIFPRVTMCDLEVRVLGNLHRHTIQCVLPFNIFSEKVFLIVWWWFTLVTIFTIVNFGLWIYRMCFLIKREKFAKDHLEKVLNKGNEDDYINPYKQENFKSFVSEYMRFDGIFIMEIIAQNTTRLFTTLVYEELWKKYCDRTKQREHHYSHPKSETSSSVGKSGDVSPAMSSLSVPAYSPPSEGLNRKIYPKLPTQPHEKKKLGKHDSDDSDTQPAPDEAEERGNYTPSTDTTTNYLDQPNVENQSEGNTATATSNEQQPEQDSVSSET